MVAIIFCGKSPKIGQTGYIPVCLQPTGLMAVAGYRSYEGCWTAFGAVGWQPTYRSYGRCLTAFGTVGWQPTGLMGLAGRPLGLYVGLMEVAERPLGL